MGEEPSDAVKVELMWRNYEEQIKAKGPSLNNKDFLMWLLFLATMVGNGPDVLKTIVGVLLK